MLTLFLFLDRRHRYCCISSMDACRSSIHDFIGSRASELPICSIYTTGYWHTDGITGILWMVSLCLFTLLITSINFHLFTAAEPLKNPLACSSRWAIFSLTNHDLLHIRMNIIDIYFLFLFHIAVLLLHAHRSHGRNCCWLLGIPKQW